MKSLNDTTETGRKFRFVTPRRTGKWYNSLSEAQRLASNIGAGFFEEKRGIFFPYKDTRLEVSSEN